MRRYPICPGCKEEVDTDPLYESLCGHDDCPSMVFHPICLMEYREHREKMEALIREFVETHREIFGRDP